MSCVNAQMQRTPCPKALSECWGFGLPVMNGQCVILGGAKNNALLISHITVPSCFLHIIGNVFPDEC